MSSIMNNATEEGEKLSLAHPCRLFSLAEIQYATNNFDDKLVIGQGGFGKVYKGYICGEQAGHVVAIKRLDSMSNQGELEFRAEINMISKLHHRHLLSLIGFCIQNKEMILVYEYMTKGTLSHHLHKAVTPLSWLRRLKIAVGAAQGLDYLHTGGVIHRDVKTSNILLDENWAAKISDFGLSKICSTNQSTSFVDASVKGTFGYLDPEYFYTSKLTRKTDVYAFGVVLFELLSGRLPVEHDMAESFSLVRWAQTCVKDRKLDQLVDSNIKGSISTKCLKQFTQIAYCCVHNMPEKRPTLTDVVALLQDILEQKEKSNDSAKSSSVKGFSLKMPKYFASNSDQSGTSSTKTLDKHMNHHEELVTRGIKEFTYNELKLATRNFANETFLGEGRYGEVYKGWVDKITYSPCNNNNGLPNIAVKKLHYKPPTLEMLEFRHPNIVQLIGYSSDSGCHFLVYEFMNNGKLKDLLSKGALAKFPLVTSVKIVLGIARGIVFLQKAELYKPGMKICKSMLDRRKILLDEDFTAKLSDYESGHNNVAEPDIEALDLVLRCNLSGYKVIFMEVLTGERIHSSRRASEINHLFTKCGMESLYDIAKLCFEMCNEEDSESKMLTLLKEHEKLILERREFGSVIKVGREFDTNVNEHEELLTGDIKMFTYDELKIATRNFGDETYLSGGRLRKVYKGWVDKTTYSPCKEATGLLVAVNIFHYLDIDMELCKEFLHPNLVKLIGCCFECHKPFFVYEFMHKGNLEDLLLCGAVARLPLVIKVNIVVEIARGIVFLQKPQFNNASLKVSGSILDRRKILLDQNYKAKLLDFDIRALLGDRYYISDPTIEESELMLECNLSGYQVIFMELLTGERIYKSSEVDKIERMFSQCGKESLNNIAALCFKICNEVGAKKKIITILQEHDELIRRRIKNRLFDPNQFTNVDKNLIRN